MPFFPQRNEWACGAAAFEMAYRYLRPSRLSKLNVDKLFRRNAEGDPHARASARIAIEDIVAAANARGLHSAWGIVSADPIRMVEQLRHFVGTLRIPVIACQRFTDDDRLAGHYRVVYGVSIDGVLLHDPHVGHGGPSQSWSYDKLIAAWRPSGKNVVGGAAIWIAADPLPSNALMPTAGIGDLWPPSIDMVSGPDLVPRMR